MAQHGADLKFYAVYCGEIKIGFEIAETEKQAICYIRMGMFASFPSQFGEFDRLHPFNWYAKQVTREAYEAKDCHFVRSYLHAKPTAVYC